MRRTQEDTTLEKLSNCYEDGELENNDSKYSEGRGNSQVKCSKTSDLGRNPRRRWDDSYKVWKAEESSYSEKSDVRSGMSSDPRHENAREKSVFVRSEASQSKSKDLGSISIKDVTASYDREDRRVDYDSSKSKSRSVLEEEDKGSPLTAEGTSVERIQNHRQQRISRGQDITDSHDRSFIPEDGNAWTGEKRIEVEHSDRSRTPEKDGRQWHESEKSDVNYKQSISLKRKELEKDIYSEDKSRGRMDNWSDRNRDWEGSKDGWKRKQRDSVDKAKDGDTFPDLSKEWELQRRNRDRMDRERSQGRSVGRKDGGRTEAVKTSSKYGISSDNYDVIEIQREGSASTFSRRSIVAPDDGARRIGMGSGPSPNDQTGLRGELGGPSLSTGGQSSASGLQPPYGDQDMASLSRTAPQGVKGCRGGRGWGRPVGRDSQQVRVPMHMMGSPFGSLGMPHPGSMQPLNPTMSPVPIPPISPGVFVPPFPPPVIWPGPRGVEMNMLAVSPGLPRLPSGTSAPRFPPNIGIPPNPGPYFSQSGTGRGILTNTSNPGFDATGPMGQVEPQDNFPGHGGWMPPRNNTSAGKAPSRGEQNDYSQNFVDTGMRPQNFIRELELSSVVEDYPKLRELIQKKDDIVVNSASPPMYYKCDLREFELSSEFFGTKFDVILVDPPWEEYVHRAPGVTDHMEYWTFEEIMNLKIEAIADVPSFIFLWVGDGVGLEQGRQCLKKWGFRRCEDICWVKTNKTNATPGLRHDSYTLFQRSKEHCLMGIKGTVRRSTDGHIIHANIDTDVIIADEPPYGSTEKPEDMYRIIEHFALGRRRLELFGEDHNIRAGWLTVGKGLSSSNFDVKAYIRNFADKDGKVWLGGGGRNPPPEAPHLVLTTPEIEALRPKSPMKNQQQLQQQSTCISIIPAKNSPQNYNAQNLNKEASSFNPSASASLDERISDIYGLNSSYCQANREYLDYESYGAMNMF